MPPRIGLSHSVHRRDNIRLSIIKVKCEKELTQTSGRKGKALTSKGGGRVKKKKSAKFSRGRTNSKRGIATYLKKNKKGSHGIPYIVEKDFLLKIKSRENILLRGRSLWVSKSNRNIRT